LTVLAAIAMFAPSYAALSAIARPIPLEAPEMNIVLPFRSPTYLKSKFSTFLITHAVFYASN